MTLQTDVLDHNIPAFSSKSAGIKMISYMSMKTYFVGTAIH